MNPGDILGPLIVLGVVLFVSGCAYWASRMAGHKPPPDDGEGIKFN